MKREKFACNCKNITYGMIEDAIKNGAKSYEDVEKQLRFGTGCGKCKEFIQFLIRDLLAEAWYNSRRTKLLKQMQDKYWEPYAEEKG